MKLTHQDPRRPRRRRSTGDGAGHPSAASVDTAGAGSTLCVDGGSASNPVARLRHGATVAEPRSVSTAGAAALNKALHAASDPVLPAGSVTIRTVFHVISASR